MKTTSISASGFLFMVMSGILDISGAFAAHGSNVSERVVSQTEKVSVEEELVNFKINEIVDPTLPSGCATDQKVENDQRMLDPQLSASDKRSKFDSASSEQCKGTEFTLGCAADQKVENDRRMLDPQLAASDKRSKFDLADSVKCKQAESTLPFNR